VFEKNAEAGGRLQTVHDIAPGVYHTTAYHSGDYSEKEQVVTEESGQDCRDICKEVIGLSDTIACGLVQDFGSTQVPPSCLRPTFTAKHFKPLGRAWRTTWVSPPRFICTPLQQHSSFLASRRCLLLASSALPLIPHALLGAAGLAHQRNLSLSLSLSLSLQ